MMFRRIVLLTEFGTVTTASTALATIPSVRCGYLVKFSAFDALESERKSHTASPCRPVMAGRPGALGFMARTLRGFPFGHDHPFTYLEGKRVLGLALAELRGSRDLPHRKQRTSPNIHTGLTRARG